MYRHNQIRDLIYSYCIRARLNLELEKAGLLEDESIMVELRRPAGVLVDGFANRNPNTQQWSKTALDVKIINALGQCHLADSAVDGLAAAEAYRQQQLEHLRTGELCAAQGISYQPLVFTAQGGCERHAEALLSQIANAVAKCEDASPMEIKADMMQRISLSLARSVAKTIERRRSHHCTATWLRNRQAQALDLLDDDADMVVD